MKLSYSTLAILALACGAATAVACSDDSTTARAAAPAAAPAARAGDDVISSMPVYAKTPGVKLSGNLNSVGSDTMNNLMTLWAEGFARHWPDVKLGVEGKGSATAPPALAEGTAQFGPMSRDMKNEEIDVFEKKHGYKPQRLRTALDALAVFVHKDNPIQSLTLEQVDAIFSKTRARGAEDIRTWGQLGLTGDWADKPIILFGRNSSSGTYGYFKEHALKKGDFKDTVKEQPGSSTVVQGVGTDRFAIGYSGIGYTTSDVRAVPLAAKAGKEAFAANLENVTSDDYPLGRYLNVYINRQPGKPLDPLVREFLLFVFSKDGQGIVEKDGYLPLPAEVASAERKLLQ